jgi:hypothetical protein
MRVPLCPAVHGHIADSVRDHEPGPGSRIALDEEAEGAVHRTACRWISMARQPQKITGGPTVWPAHSPRPSREPCWYRGIAVDGGGTVQNATTGHGRTGSRLPHQFPLTSYSPAMYLRWIFHVPRGTVPLTTARGQKDPLSAQS